MENEIDTTSLTIAAQSIQEIHASRINDLIAEFLRGHDVKESSRPGNIPMPSDTILSMVRDSTFGGLEERSL